MLRRLFLLDLAPSPTLWRPSRRSRSGRRARGVCSHDAARVLRLLPGPSQGLLDPTVGLPDPAGP
eukprot:6742380-Alexandrium_andersonii.AAC.1